MSWQMKKTLTCPEGCLKRDNFQTLSFLDCSWTAGRASEENKEKRFPQRRMHHDLQIIKKKP